MMKCFRFGIIAAIFVSWHQSMGQITDPDTLIRPSYEIVLVDSRWPSKPFLITVPANNIQGVADLDRYLAGGAAIGSDGYVGIGVANGLVQRILTAPSVNHGWKFRLDPNTVRFSDLTIELCDGNFGYVEAHLDEWIRTVKNYCPWSTGLLVKHIRKFWNRRPAVPRK